MSSPQFNIKVQRVSYELTTVQYKSPKGCPMSSPQLNIEVWRVSHELTTVQYKILEGVL
jgi:hypothetical protein